MFGRRLNNLNVPIFNLPLHFCAKVSIDKLFFGTLRKKFLYFNLFFNEIIIVVFKLSFRIMTVNIMF